ncbi:hypothetical protein HDU81_002637, partial [Chytriomyces hyalinus]
MLLASSEVGHFLAAEVQDGELLNGLTRPISDAARRAQTRGPFSLNRPKKSDQLEPHIQQLSQNLPPDVVACERLIGNPFRVQALWPTNLHTYLLLCRSFLSAPLCDLGLSNISADFRRHIMALTSMVAECPSCTLGIVTIKNQGTSNLRLVEQAASGESGKSVFKEGEKYALNAIVSATKLPARRGERARVNLVKYYGESGLQKIALICGYLGFTNTIGELLCLPVDMQALSRATSTSLSGTGYTVAETRVKDLSSVTSRKGSSFANLVQAFSKTEQLLRGFPSSSAQLNTWMQTRFGFVPRYMLKMQAGG